MIVTPTCPLRPLVVSNPTVAALDTGLWRGLVASAVDELDADDVGCSAHDCLQPCASCPWPKKRCQGPRGLKGES